MMAKSKGPSFLSGGATSTRATTKTRVVAAPPAQRERDPVARAHDAVGELAKSARETDPAVAEAARVVAVEAIVLLLGLANGEKVGATATFATERRRAIVQRAYDGLRVTAAAVMKQQIERAGHAIAATKDGKVRRKVALTALVTIANQWPQDREKFYPLMQPDRQPRLVALLATCTGAASKRGRARGQATVRQWHAIAAELLIEAGVYPRELGIDPKRLGEMLLHHAGGKLGRRTLR